MRYNIRHMKNLSKLLPGLLVLFAITTSAPAAEQWRTYNHCRLIPNEANDGDSFHAFVNGKERILRLYFVDCPETDESFPERVAEQAAHFGITKTEAIAIGKKAAHFTTQQLKEEFTVTTRWDDARGRSKLPRFYALIIVNGKDLAETLLENGLARAYGEKAAMPDGTSGKGEAARLQRLEQHAKTERMGAWELKDDQRSHVPGISRPLMPPLPDPAKAAGKTIEKQNGRDGGI